MTLDVFCCAAQYCDLASLAAIPRYTCGDVHYYPGGWQGGNSLNGMKSACVVPWQCCLSSVLM